MATRDTHTHTHTHTRALLGWRTTGQGKEQGEPTRGMPGPDGIRKQWSKRHGAAVKQGIKKAKARKRVVKQATLALRKAPSKQAIVQGLFTPKSPREAEVEAEAEAEAEEMAEETR